MSLYGTQFTTLHVPMPIAGTTNAPKFKGKFTRDFLNLVLQHGKSAGINDSDDLVDYIYHYSSDEVKEVIRYVPEFDVEVPNKTWDEAKNKLLLLYKVGDEPAEITLEALKDFCKRSSAKSSFTKSIEVETYQREFIKLAAPLVKKSILTTQQQDFYFVNGLPSSMKEWFMNQVPEAQRKKTNPPPIANSIDILNRRFDSDSLIYEDWKHEKEREAKKVRFDENGDRVDGESKHQSRASTPTPAKSSATTDIDALTKQLEGLSLNQAQLVALLTAMAGGNSETAQSNPMNGFNTNRTPGKRCFICGKWDTHPLHPSRCPETKALIDEQRIKYDISRDRYVLPDGRDLPQTPRGFFGGVADFLRSMDPNNQPGTSSAQNTARTSAIGLSYDASDVLRGDVFAVSSLSPDDYYANPSLRSGKDTSLRFDPMRRPESKGKGKETEAPKPSTPTPQPQPTAPAPGPSRAPISTTIPAPTNPINRQDGWKNSRPSNAKSKDDVEMKDGTNKKPTDKSSSSPQFHYTSDIQDMADPKAVMKQLLNLDVTVPLFQLVGNSPVLQKMMGEATRTKREYVSKQAEYSDFVEEYYPTGDDEQLERVMATTYEFENANCKHRRLYCENPHHLPEFLKQYGNAIAEVPSTRYFAMTTGSLHLTINGTDFTAMIDTGSELNLATNSLPARCGLAIDFEGMKWSLKGIHGDPERLSGCATDVPLRIGSHDFIHHLFVSNQELGKHDIILGQPFLQWFASRLDYDRNGQVKMILWKDGDRRGRPTLAITITDPQDSRNATKISHNAHASTAATLEEVSDEEDFRG